MNNNRSLKNSYWLVGGLGILDNKLRISQINQELADFLGGSIDVLRNRDFFEVFSLHYPTCIETIRKASQSPETFTRFTLKINLLEESQWFQCEWIHHQGDSIFRICSILPPREELEEGSWNEYLSSEEARRDMFVRLMQSEARLESLMQRWPGVIFSQRADFSFRFVSPKMEALTGIPLVEWQRQSHRFWDIIHEADIDELRRQIKRAGQSPEGISCTYRIRHVDTGHIAYVWEHRQAMLSHNGLVLGYEGVWLDVTRQTIAEKRLSSAAWKETLAVITMGLAHDFSNIMAGIHALSESFLAQVDHNHAFYEGLSLIKQNSMQASQLVHRIIQLHHGKTGERSYQNLNDIINDVADLARKMLPRRVQVTVELSPEALPIYIDPVEFCQVILNLTLNASDAMPNGGKLTYHTSRHQNFDSQVQYQGCVPRSPCVCLSVQDTGCGIPSKYLSTIFDPFFTTKAMNKGSGLGLYNAKLFVEKHLGAITIESAEMKGAKFSVWLPEADFTEAERTLSENRGKRLSLLMLGRASQAFESNIEMLRVRGYHVVPAETSQQMSELLESPEYNFVGALLLVETAERDCYSWWRRLVQNRNNFKSILHISGCNQDELDTQFINQFDLIVNTEMSEEEIINRINKTFKEIASA